ncbi:MAG TPA: cupredoxin domain-containing protein [Patescibacteria group bacterium]|nr:cupredoxin domain-containing protein [Patescibacteria group bacterium]
MNLSEIFVLAAGLSLIGFVYWFFFGKKYNEVVANDNDKVKILVSGRYKPDVIRVKKGAATSLLLTRTDSNPCLEEFIIPDFKIKKYLPMNKVVEIKLNPEQIGTWDFHCGMNMNHGKLIVE